MPLVGHNVHGQEDMLFRFSPPQRLLSFWVACLASMALRVGMDGIAPLSQAVDAS